MSSKNFKVLELIGKGSFASVYKVIRKTDGKIYAMKRVKITKMSRKEISDALNEVRFLASIRHPNIVGFFEAFLENNDTELCIVMEFCGSGDLCQKIERYKRKRQYINENKIWLYLIQSLRALQVLHSNGICHRDLKAANTFLSEDGSIKIGDMNVSKQLKEGHLQTQIGTPYYMPPEIWNNQSYDERCDIWSLGCMIFELASLRPPFLGDSFASLKRSVVQGRFPPLPKCYSTSLTKIITLMLKVNPKERFNATQLLNIPEIIQKQNEIEGLDPSNDKNKLNREIIGTIKIPQMLKKLNEALPKPCYPEMILEREGSTKENYSSKPPLPPEPKLNPKEENQVQSVRSRNDKYPQSSEKITSIQPQPPSKVGGIKSNNPRLYYLQKQW